MKAMVTLSLLMLATCAAPQQTKTAPSDDTTLPVLAPGAPVDNPVHARTGDEVQAIAAAIAPYIEQARATYPDAKRRYLSGLPAGHHFYVTTRLRSEGRTESVFIAVKKIEGSKVSGVIANDVHLLKDFKSGQSVTVAEADIDDWVITNPDGTEEGNVVGKFLEKRSAEGEPSAR